MQITRVASRSPSYSPASSASRVIGPSSRDARHPVGQRDLGQVDQHGARPAVPEQDPERHADHDDHDAHPHVEPERPGPRLVGAPRHHHDRSRRPTSSSSRNGLVVNDAAAAEPERPHPPGHRVQVARQPARPASGRGSPADQRDRRRRPRTAHRCRPGPPRRAARRHRRRGRRSGGRCDLGRLGRALRFGRVGRCGHVLVGLVVALRAGLVGLVILAGLVRCRPSRAWPTPSGWSLGEATGCPAGADDPGRRRTPSRAATATAVAAAPVVATRAVARAGRSVGSGSSWRRAGGSGGVGRRCRLHENAT